MHLEPQTIILRLNWSSTSERHPSRLPSELPTSSMEASPSPALRKWGENCWQKRVMSWVKSDHCYSSFRKWQWNIPKFDCCKWYQLSWLSRDPGLQFTGAWHCIANFSVELPVACGRRFPMPLHADPSMTRPRRQVNSHSSGFRESPQKKTIHGVELKCNQQTSLELQPV